MMTYYNITNIISIIYYTTVSFHNFKSRNLKLSVSNLKSKYVAYVYVPSQISNCQGLGRKNKHEILKTDRIVLNTGCCCARARQVAAGSAIISPTILSKDPLISKKHRMSPLWQYISLSKSSITFFVSI